MKIGIMCFRSYDSYQEKSELALQEAAKTLGHEGILLEVPLFTFEPNGEILYDGQSFPELDGLISRARVIDQVENRLFVLKLLEEKGLSIMNGYPGLVVSKNKWFATERLRRAGISIVPTWVVEDERMATRFAQKIGYPVVLKMSYGTYGLGVAKAENEQELKEVLARFWKKDFIQPLLIQPFIAEAQGRDHRVFVIGREVVASMERRAQAGDFRTYSPKVEDASIVNISMEEKDLAVTAVAAMGLDYAGVDIIETTQGPAVLEVNGNPGLMRISAVTGVDVPLALMQLAVSRFQQDVSAVRKK